MITKDLIDEAFIRFSRIAHGDDQYSPYPWQLRLARQVALTGRWPARIVAPTGAGKTSVVDVHLFVQALAGLKRIDPPSRRLALIVNRRALVDSQYAYAIDLVAAVAQAAKADRRAAEFLSGWRQRSGTTDGTGVQIVNLRGGQSVKDPQLTSWRQHPDRISILAFTPDLFGSRLLFRGYGVSTGARPIEGGLLAYDTVAIVDEAHLSQQLVLTAQQVHRIESAAENPLPLFPLQTVVTTATPQQASDAAAEVQVTEADLAQSERLRSRLRTPKPVQLLDLPGSLAETAALEAFVQAAVALHDRARGTIGVVVNSVAAALAVTSQLRKVFSPDEVVQVVGRQRPYDRQRIQDTHPGLLDASGNSDVAIVVGTQTLEVGLDIGFAAMLTELAPADALAQRAGRVNRFAAFDEGPIVVAVPPKEYRDHSTREGRRTHSVYAADDLNDTLEWLQAFIASAPAEGLSPWAVKEQGDALPRTSDRRAVLQRLEWWDVETLSATSEHTAAEEQIGQAGPATLDAWLRDDLDDVGTAGVAVRSRLPASDGLARQVLKLTPLLDEEIAQVPIGQLYAFAKRDDTHSARAFVIHSTDDEDDLPEVVTEATAFGEGDVLVLSQETEAFISGVFAPSGTEQLDDVLDQVLERRAKDQRGGAARRESLGAEAAPSVPPRWVVRIATPAFDPDGAQALPASGTEGLTRDDLWQLADQLRLLQFQQLNHDAPDASHADADTGPTVLSAFIEWLYQHPIVSSTPDPSGDQQLTGASLGELRRLAGGDPHDREVLSKVVTSHRATIEYIGTDDPDDEYTIIFTSNLPSDDDFTQVSTPGRAPVLLSAHQRDVGDRAALLATRIGLDAFAVLLQSAGLLHDEGKKDTRFQRLLGGGRLPKVPWAKSRIRSRSFERVFRWRHGLVGWRHEQRSAVEAWVQLADKPQSQRDLVTRLVGTTHGHGLASFAQGPSMLLPSDEPGVGPLLSAAEELFGRGEWEALVERTSRRYGLWGIAYLEAVLRAADTQISGEGQ